MATGGCSTSTARPWLGRFGGQRAWPYGQVLRIDPADGSYEPFAVGLRNPYDLALRSDGEWFSVDSDMEWDVGLPWYRPVRALLKGKQRMVLRIGRTGEGTPGWLVLRNPLIR